MWHADGVSGNEMLIVAVVLAVSALLVWLLVRAVRAGVRGVSRDR